MINVELTEDDVVSVMSEAEKKAARKAEGMPTHLGFTSQSRILVRAVVAKCEKILPDTLEVTKYQIQMRMSGKPLGVGVDAALTVEAVPKG